MSNPNPSEFNPVAESSESFEDILSQYEKSHSRKKEDGGKQLEATVIAVSSESVFFDIGFKTEGIMPLAVFQSAGESVKPGDKLPVTVKGRDPEGYYELSRQKIAQPTDWSSLEQAFADKATIVGTVTSVIKGGFSVDVGVRAFMPASRSGARDAAEMEKLVGQEIRCRIIKLDATEEDVVVDRRAVAEEEERIGKERRYSEIRKAKRYAAPSAASRTTALSSIWAAWTACCTWARSPGAASTNPQTCSRWGSRSRPGCSKSIPKSGAFHWA